MILLVGVLEWLVEHEDGDVIVGGVLVPGLEQLVDEDLRDVTLVIV